MPKELKSCSANISRAILACCVSFYLLPMNTWAGQFPVWEAGAGIAVINFPDYRGSDERQTYLLPIPYIVYRGEVLKVDRQQVRGLFFKSDKVELDVSVNGSVPVKSQDNRARQGMPDLDPTLEIGPSLNFLLHRSSDKKFKLNMGLPIRAVIASDFSHVRHAGWMFQPNLNIDFLNVLGADGWNFGIVAGPMFSDRRYHQYIYGVDPAYATAERPAYSSRGGYAGSQLLAALRKRYPGFWVGGFVKWDNLNGAVFADSPLVKTKQYLTAGFAVSWIFSRSKTTVEADD
jgi:outer membrane scaffolding protein for murein synthesis (MipA/OmpV family)